MAGLKRTFDEFVIDGQRYERIGEEAFNTVSGKIAVLVTWKTNCPDCNAEFTYTNKARPAPEHPKRRCTACLKKYERIPLVRQLANKVTKSTGVTSGTPEIHAQEVTATQHTRHHRRAEYARSQVQDCPHPAATRPKTPHKPDVFTDR